MYPPSRLPAMLRTKPPTTHDEGTKVAVRGAFDVRPDQQNLIGWRRRASGGARPLVRWRRLPSGRLSGQPRPLLILPRQGRAGDGSAAPDHACAASARSTVSQLDRLCWARQPVGHSSESGAAQWARSAKGAATLARRLSRRQRGRWVLDRYAFVYQNSSKVLLKEEGIVVSNVKTHLTRG